MSILLCSGQSGSSLEEHLSCLKLYQPPRLGLNILSKLRCLPYHRPVYLATTEYSDLILIPQDNPDVSPYVKIYDGVVESLMPEDLAPWPGATLEGRYKNEDEAVELILLGLQTWAQI